MPIKANVEGVGTLVFPDDTPQEVIQSKVKEYVSRSQTTSRPSLEQVAASGPSVGEMRRREGEGGISALDQAVQESNPSFLSRLGEAIQAGSAAQQFSTTSDTPEQRAKNRAQGAGFVAGLVAPELAAFAAPGVFAAAPAAGVTGGLARAASLASGGALSGAAQQGTEEAMTGFQEGAGGRILGSTALGTGAGMVGAALERYLPAAYQAVKGLVTSGPRAAATTAFRPSFVKSASQISAEEARNLIHDTTGIDVPMGVGEAVGTPQLANDIKNIEAGTEISPEAKDAIKREVVFAATNLRNTGVTVNDLAKYTVNSLEAQLGRLSAPAKKAVEDASKELHGQISSAFSKIQNEAKALVPGTAATPTAIGERLRSHVTEPFAELNAAEQTAYEEAKALPEYSTVKVSPTNTQSWFDSLGQKTVQQDVNTPTGVVTKPIESMLPAGTGAFGTATTKLSPEQTLEQMRNFRSQVGNSIGNDTIFPGRSDYEKKQLYKAVSQDIDAAVSALPTGDLKTKLQTATALTKDKYARFDNPVIDKVLKEFGAEGGAGSASIAAKLESPDAPSFLKELKNAAGPARSAGIDKDVSEYLFNQAGDAARNSATGQISAGKLLNQIDKLAPEVRNQFFPGYNKVVELARQEGALSKLDPSKIVSTLEIDDPALLHDALGSKPAADVTTKLKDAFAKSKALDDQLMGSVVGAIRTNDGEKITEAVASNPARFVRGITDGSRFSPDQVRKAFSLIASENPKLVNDIQFHYVNDLLSGSGGEGRISASNLLKDLRGESPISKAGKLREISEAVLGPNKTSNLEVTLQALGNIEKAGGDLTSNSPLLDLVARGVGAAAGATTRGMTGIGTIGAANELGTIARQSAKIRYAFASWVLTSPELRKLATTPISRIDADTGRRLVSGFSNFIVDTFGPDSPEADQVHTMSIDAHR